MVTNININNENLPLDSFPYGMEVIRNKDSFIETYHSLYDYFYTKMFELVNPGEQCDIFFLQKLHKLNQRKEIIKRISEVDQIELELETASSDEIDVLFYDHFYVILWIFDFACDEFNIRSPQSFIN